MLALGGRLPGKRRKLPAAVFGTGAVGETGRWGGSFEGRPAGRIFGFGDHPSGPPTGPFALMVPPALPSCATPRPGCPGATAEGGVRGLHRRRTRRYHANPLGIDAFGGPVGAMRERGGAARRGHRAGHKPRRAIRRGHDMRAGDFAVREELG